MVWKMNNLFLLEWEDWSRELAGWCKMSHCQTNSRWLAVSIVESLSGVGPCFSRRIRQPRCGEGDRICLVVSTFFVSKRVRLQLPAIYITVETEHQQVMIGWCVGDWQIDRAETWGTRSALKELVLVPKKNKLLKSSIWWILFFRRRISWRAVYIILIHCFFWIRVKILVHWSMSAPTGPQEPLLLQRRRFLRQRGCLVGCWAKTMTLAAGLNPGAMKEGFLFLVPG